MTTSTQGALADQVAVLLGGASTHHQHHFRVEILHCLQLTQIAVHPVVAFSLMVQVLM